MMISKTFNNQTKHNNKIIQIHKNNKRIALNLILSQLICQRLKMELLLSVN